MTVDTTCMHGGRDARRPVTTWACALALALLSACTASPIDLAETSALPAHEGIAFGRVRFVLDGEATENFTSILGDSSMSVLILPEHSSHGTYAPLRGNGYFFWHLPAGGYTVAGFEGRSSPNAGYHIQGRVFADFQVAPDTATYIGTLTLLLKNNRYARAVSDDYEPAVAEFRQRFPQRQGEVRKALMVLEKER